MSAPANKIVLTSKMLHSAATWKGEGFNKKQLAVLGIKWPPKSGWLKDLVGKEVTLEQWEDFQKLSGARNKGCFVAEQLSGIVDIVKDSGCLTMEQLDFLYELRDLLKRLKFSEYQSLRDRKW